MKNFDWLIQLVFVICLVSIAGCTNTTSKPDPTPTPQIVYVTVTATPTPTITLISESPTNATEAATGQQGTIIVTIPSMDALRTGDQASQLRDEVAYADVFLDGVKIGEVNSAVPSTFRVDVGTHKINVVTQEGFDYGYKMVMVEFGKTVQVSYARDPLANTASKNAEKKATQTGLLTFTGSGDDLHKFTVTSGGGFILYSDYTGSSNFIVEIDDQNGNMLELPVNKIGSYNGKDIVNLEAGTYYLKVRASGLYRIQIIPS